jgi:hypothetical protein
LEKLQPLLLLLLLLLLLPSASALVSRQLKQVQQHQQLPLQLLLQLSSQEKAAVTCQGWEL